MIRIYLINYNRLVWPRAMISDIRRLGGEPHHSQCPC